MSNKDALQRYEPELPSPWYGRAAVVGIIADAHAHYESQVRQLGGLARPDAQPPTDRALQLMKLVEQHAGYVAQVSVFSGDAASASASKAADLYNRINALAQEMSADVADLTDEQIIAIRRHTSPTHHSPWADTLAFARAIIAAMKEKK